MMGRIANAAFSISSCLALNSSTSTSCGYGVVALGNSHFIALNRDFHGLFWLVQFVQFLNQRLDDLFAMAQLYKVEEAVPTDRPVINIQDRVQAKIQQLITDCEEAIDTIPNLNIYEWLAGKEASSQAATAIRDFYAKCIGDHEPDEFDTRAEKKARADQKKFWEEFVALVDRFINNKKAVKVRKPREKKVKSAVELIKNLKFQKEDKDLKIVSVHPAEIIGATQLWVYNTKYRKLTQYVTQSPNGFGIKGTSLTGWDTELSGIGRAHV